jgi:general secretion pathway protein D
MTIRCAVVVRIRSARVSRCALTLGVCLGCLLGHGGGELGAQELRLPPPAGPRAEKPLTSVLLQPGDLTLRDTPLADALLTISEIWKVNLVVGGEVQGRVNGVFRDVPLCRILDSILLANGYGYQPLGQSLVIMQLQELGELNPMFQSVAITLAHADPTEVLESIRLLSSPRGKVQAIPSARALMVLDFPDRVARIRQFVDQLDRASGQAVGKRKPQEEGTLRVAQFAPQFITASSLQAAVQTMLSKDGKAAAMEPNNRLIVTDGPAQLELVRQVVEQLDVPRLQVRITALIYDLDIRDVERLGINWNSLLKDRYDAEGNPQSVFQIDSFLSVPVSANVADGAMTFMNLSRHFDITAVVKALQEAKDSRLLANPNVTVLDHEKATMSIITEIPYQQLTQTQQGGNIGTTAFREAGVKLEVTPHVAADGTIRMEVMPTFSRLTGYTPGQQPQPIIDRREAQTAVRVANRQVLIIGGLRQRNDTGDFNGLPYLKDIKLFNLGALFRGRDTEVRESELVVFIVPEIIPSAHAGSCREAVALQHGQCLLGQIPVATGGRPPHRPVPCWPPAPIGGQRVFGTPYQPETCPPPQFNRAPTQTLQMPPDTQFAPPPDGPGIYDQQRPPADLRMPDAVPGPPHVPQGVPQGAPVVSGAMTAANGPPSRPNRPVAPQPYRQPIRHPPIRASIVGVRAIAPPDPEPVAPWRRSHRRSYESVSRLPRD